MRYGFKYSLERGCRDGATLRLVREECTHPGDHRRMCTQRRTDWGTISDSGRTAAIAEYKFADVLSVESMLKDLHTWMPQQWADKIKQLRYWSDELFNYLA